MSGNEKRIGLTEFIEMFTFPEVAETPESEMDAVAPVRQVQVGSNGEFLVDDLGVRAIIPTVAEMDDMGLFGEERMALIDFYRGCQLTWPVSLDEVRVWAEMIGLEVAEQEAMVPPAAEYLHLPAKRGRKTTQGMNEAMSAFVLRWNQAQQEGKTSPPSKKELATAIAKETWPGILEIVLNSRINTLLSRTRAGKSVPNESDTQREGKSGGDPLHLFLSSRPPHALR